MDNFDAQTNSGEQKYRGVLIESPKVESISIQVKRPWLPRKLDYAAREEPNRKLGYAGEQWAIGLEKIRLIDEGRPDLIEDIDWISDRLGGVAGYDISSYKASAIACFSKLYHVT